MIEVDLSPGGLDKGRRRSRKPLQGIKMPSMSGLRADPWILVPAVVLVGALGAMGYLFTSVAGAAEELEVEIEAAEADSARYAEVIERTEGLQARRDTIAERVGIIQDLDQGRYRWPRVMNEVSQALPDFTWLTQVVQTGGEEESFDFRVQGSAGNYFALTTFMENLEDSAFIRNVQLVSTDQVSAGDDDRFVHEFILEASTDSPPSDAVETVPLFPDGTPAEVEELMDDEGEVEGGG